MTEYDPSLERKLVTILSADVAEYSRLMAEDEEQTLKTFRAHRTVIDQLVALHRGRIFNTAGDAFLAEFGSAVEAVRCATEIQSALRTRNEKLPKNREVRFRIGVNLGDVLVQGSDLLGDGVNIAARLQGAADPGGVCISGSVYDQISSKLSLEMHSLGEKTYKNIPQPVRTFSVESGTPGSSGKRYARSGFPQWLMPGFAAAFALLGMGFYFAHKLEFPANAPGRPGAAAKAPMPVDGKAQAQAPASASAPVAPARPILLPEKSAQKFKPQAKSAPAKWLVDPGSSGLRTISEAVAKAAPGDVIEVRPGHYAEKFDFKQSLLIRGLADESGNLGVRIEQKGGEVIRITSGSVRLENIEIVQLTNPESARDSALVIDGGLLTLANSGVWSAGDFASNAFTIHGGQSIVTDSTFHGRRGIDQMGGRLRCENCASNGNLEEGAVVMNQASDPAMTSEFLGYEAKGNGFHGIAVMQGARVQLKNCVLSANGISGVEAIQTGHVTLANCNTSDNLGNGAVAGDNAWIEVTGGESSRNKFSGAAAKDSAHLSVRGAELSRNGEFGYALTDKANGVNERNKLEANHAGAVFRSPASR